MLTVEGSSLCPQYLINDLVFLWKEKLALNNLLFKANYDHKLEEFHFFFATWAHSYITGKIVIVKTQVEV